MELTDTHCHIQSVGGFAGEESTRELWAKARDNNPEDVLRRAHEAGVTRLICVGCDVEDSRLAVEFVQGRANCWASVGIHPHEADRYVDDARNCKELAAMAARPKVVAIGECGLDYFHNHASKEEQAAVLRSQIELALERDLPLIFHVRDAFADFWPIFESYQMGQHRIRGVLHSFTDSVANLERALQHGLYLGVNGIATFTKSPEQQAMYRKIPLDKLLLETDAPFLTPSPHRGTICEPYHIRTIAAFLAGQRNEAVERLAKATAMNATALFGLK